MVFEKLQFLFQFPNLNKLSIVGVINFFFLFSNLIQVQVIVIHTLHPDNFIHGLALITLKTRQLFLEISAQLYGR